MNLIDFLKYLVVFCVLGLIVMILVLAGHLKMSEWRFIRKFRKGIKRQKKNKQECPEIRVYTNGPDEQEEVSRRLKAAHIPYTNFSRDSNVPNEPYLVFEDMHFSGIEGIEYFIRGWRASRIKKS